MGISLKEQLPPERVAETPFGDVYLYAAGLCKASVCAPVALERVDVEYAVNKLHPTGLGHGWTISDDAAFKDGEPNPCACQEDAERRHWLLEC